MYDLEERLIHFAVRIIELNAHFPDTALGKHLSLQLMRSGTSPALNYGEAQGAESSKDFLHKLRLCLKELRESQINLKITLRAGLIAPEMVQPTLQECNQLVAIFTSSVKTAKAKNQSSP
ncbi:MAG: four helix bundle protein [Bacteroidetes bacterium]|nr:MAG: four helix bundle protein [Bacteroidota bacterium]